MNQSSKTQELKSTVVRALSQIKHREIKDQNIVDLGMVPEIRVEDQLVTVTLAFPFREVPETAELSQRVEKITNEACHGMKTKVEVRQMTPEERSDFTARAQGQEPISPASREVRNVIAVMSGKGGVGKSSVAALLACAIRRRGTKVGILDADITGPSIPHLFGTHTPPFGGEAGIQPPETATGIKLISINLLLSDENQPVVWRGPLIGRAIQQFWNDIAWGDLDFLIVDLPPGTSDAALTVMQSLPVHGMLLVTSPQDLAGMVVRKAANMAKRLGVPLIGLLENMSYFTCPQCGHHIEIFGPSRSQKTTLQSEVPMLGTLPLDPQLAVMCDQGKIEDYHNEDFERITDRVLQFVGVESHGTKQ
ncbi:MAG: MRP family ATP-binding protein [Anaerolineales bacterium]|nr:MAG: MRP family ATP-binding protein [Anaerolineales bacterium]